MSYATGLIGVWIFADAWYSLVLYHDKHESFWRCHSIRVIRLLCGIGLIIMGALNV